MPPILPPSMQVAAELVTEVSAGVYSSAQVIVKETVALTVSTSKLNRGNSPV